MMEIIAFGAPMKFKSVLSGLSISRAIKAAANPARRGLKLVARGSGRQPPHHLAAPGPNSPEKRRERGAGNGRSAATSRRIAARFPFGILHRGCGYARMRRPRKSLLRGLWVFRILVRNIPVDKDDPVLENFGIFRDFGFWLIHHCLAKKLTNKNR